MRARLLPFVLGVLWAAASAACVSVGDREIVASEVGEQSTCDRYCALARSADCQVGAGCEEVCRVQANRCSVESDTYLRCVYGAPLSCDAAGAVTTPSRCVAAFDAFHECQADRDWYELEPSEQCSRYPDRASCQDCCAGFNEAAVNSYDVFVKQCVCAADACAADCRGFCGGVGTDSAECSSCIGREAASCDAVVTPRCEADLHCPSYLSCSQACP